MLAESVWLFSEQDPNPSEPRNQKSKKLAKLYKTAMKDVQDYIKMVKRSLRIGFKYADFLQDFNLNDLQGQTEDMFPGYTRPRAPGKRSAGGTEQKEFTTKKHKVLYPPSPETKKSEPTLTPTICQNDEKSKSTEDFGQDSSMNSESISPTSKCDRFKTHRVDDQFSPSDELPLAEILSRMKSSDSTSKPGSPSEVTSTRISIDAMLEEDTSLHNMNILISEEPTFVTPLEQRKFRAVKSFPTSISPQQKEIISTLRIGGEEAANYVTESPDPEPQFNTAPLSKVTVGDILINELKDSISKLQTQIEKRDAEIFGLKMNNISLLKTIREEYKRRSDESQQKVINDVSN